jgi:FMN phosphatase YigB (HAD superfamily)
MIYLQRFLKAVILMIQNIIFDLGGVVLDVDYNKTVEAFGKLDIPGFQQLYSQKKQDKLFDRFERGDISAADFRAVIREMKSGLTDAAIDKAWDSMILDTPPERIAFLQQLGKKYDLYLLSNTNEIHIPAFTKYFDEAYGKGTFRSLFKKIYLSSEVRMRKPEAAIFNLVIDENHLDKKRTLFIDDSPQHVEGAINAGLQAVLLPPGEKIETWLEGFMSRYDL